MKYAYLFPYEKIPQGSRIVIYGAGDVGQEYMQQMELTRYCEVVAFVDRAFDKYMPMIVPIYPVEKIRELDFDYVVLAFKMGAHVRVVTKVLLSMDVKAEKIIYMEPRREVAVLLSTGECARERKLDFAYLHDGISIALKYGPGLGDAIVKKKFFTELVGMAPSCQIDIYSPGASGIISSMYSDQENLNLVIDDGGALYASQKSQYDVAFTVAFMLEVDGLKFDRLNDVAPEFSRKMEKLQESVRTYNLPATGVMSRYVHFNRMKFLGLNYYSYLNYTGVFNIRNHDVYIPLNPDYGAEYEKLALPKRYITVNYGGGVDSSGSSNSIAKDWPLSHMEMFVRLFKCTYPGIEVLQVGSAETAEISGVDKYFLGESLELVKYILRGSLLHVDKEGGLVHLATQLGTKCIVCFGPTQEEFFGYPENINLKAGNCHGCHCLYDGFDVCARGMEKPECMWSITPEIVMEKVEQLEEMNLSVHAEKVLLAFYRFYLESIDMIENTEINSTMMGMHPMQFKKALEELAGNNIYKRYYINTDSYREQGVPDSIICVSPACNSRICEDGIKYVEEKYKIAENDKNKIDYVAEIIDKIDV